MASMLDCGLAVSKFDLQLNNYILLWINTLEKGMNTLIPTVMGKKVLLLYFYKDGFGIR